MRSTKIVDFSLLIGGIALDTERYRLAAALVFREFAASRLLRSLNLIFPFFRIQQIPIGSLVLWHWRNSRSLVVLTDFVRMFRVSLHAFEVCVIVSAVVG
jgi:hypothetical protein